MLGFGILALGATNLYGQRTTVTSGGQATGTGGTVSYSIGQVVYIPATGSGGTITQGQQQPYEILTIAGIEEADISLSAIVCPNPTTEVVVLKVETVEKLSYQLYDLDGKLHLNEKVKGSQTTVSMANLPPAIYFLTVRNTNKLVKSFKSIKN